MKISKHLNAQYDAGGVIFSLHKDSPVYLLFNSKNPAAKLLKYTVYNI